MTEKKYLIIAVLATFCLTATLFMVVPTKSQSGSYDPWTDVNGDGSIDMADVSMVLDGYMTSGDSTKDVNVTNWPSTQNTNVANLPLDGLGNLRANVTAHATKLIKAAEGFVLAPNIVWWTSPNYMVEGYSKVSINIKTSGTGPNFFILWSLNSGEGYSFKVDEGSFDLYFVRTYDVMNQMINLVVINHSSQDEYIYVNIYLVA